MTTETGRNIVETRVKESWGVEAAGTITPHEVGHQLFGTEQAAAHLFEDKQQLFQGIRLSLQPSAARRESGGPPSCPPTQKRSQTDIETELH